MAVDDGGGGGGDLWYFGCGGRPRWSTGVARIHGGHGESFSHSVGSPELVVVRGGRSGEGYGDGDERGSGGGLVGGGGQQNVARVWRWLVAGFGK
ncbi:pollen-specific leucine-rich repeat extensin-like protein 3 [Iris pallida]|uniref:Pollen-specific leucine-rich repeat extensin-like protein 3 n=1 Tax=Iris pallida TaxID=29817 RepID=A0AAX6DH53_IRIPA|nr:pollen-specific leucine-rich repeat extensin-like protein 3 [Iris pallida]